MARRPTPSSCTCCSKIKSTICLISSCSGLGLLSSASSDIFLRYFKDSLKELVRLHIVAHGRENPAVPQDFLVNHITGSFVEMTLWWIKGGRKMMPEDLDRCFRAVIEPIL